MEIHNIADQKLERLSEDPNNIVYRYADQKAPDVVMPLTVVKDHILALWREFKKIKGDKTPTYTQTRQIREKMCKKNPTWKKFSTTHPLIFDRVVDHRTGEPEIQALLYMIFLKTLQNKDEIQDGAQQLQSYIFDTFSMTEEEYREQNKDADVNIIDPTKQKPV